tara:strand:- start:321 stop:1241 length:921 start_codon:yes stop_codon:yes gene_type:complete
MNILITGGTGSVGKILVPMLLEKNYKLTLTTRNRQKAVSKNSEWADKVKFIETEYKMNGDWLKQVELNDIIINMVGANVFSRRWTMKRKNILIDSRVEPTQMLIDTIKQVEKKPSLFIQISGSEYPNSSKKEFYESDRLSDKFLGELMRKWENPSIKLKNKDVRTIVFRMGPVLGYDWKNIERMFIPHKLFIGGKVGNGRQIYPWVHVKDFANIILWGIENEKVKGIINGVAPDKKSMIELAKIGGHILKRKTWTWAPGFGLRLVLGERADTILNGRAVNSNKLLEYGYKFLYPNAGLALIDILKK